MPAAITWACFALYEATAGDSRLLKKEGMSLRRAAFVVLSATASSRTCTRTSAVAGLVAVTAKTTARAALRNGCVSKGTGVFFFAVWRPTRRLTPVAAD